jgi:hypothetical protein
VPASSIDSVYIADSAPLKGLTSLRELNLESTAITYGKEVLAELQKNGTIIYGAPHVAE